VRGAGLTLMAGEDQSVSSGVTIWQADFEPGFTPLPAGSDAAATARLYDDLVAPAATWLRYHMEDSYGGGDRSGLAGDWRSRALFDAGIHMAELGRPDAAKTMYLRALGWDPDNDGARLNLALMLPPGLHNQIEQLRYVTATSRDRQGDVTYYSAAFSLVMTLVDANRRPEAAVVAEELVARVDQTLADLRSARRRLRRRASANEELERYLRVIAPSARVIAAGLTSQPLPATVDLLWPSIEFQYNLACYFSMLGEGTLTRSVEHLEFAAALDRARVAQYAAVDQATVLRAVATDASTKPRFDAVIAPPAPAAAAPSRLAQLAVIGETHAAALASNGVASPSDLVVRCATTAGARALATTMGVAVASVLHWARAAELLELAGMEPGHVNALTLAGLDSLGALRGLSTASITAAIADHLVQTPVPTPAPPAATIDAWALAAAGAPSLVVAPPTLG
jgi:tetratricopeptide (TPR) repeat protein